MCRPSSPSPTANKRPRPEPPIEEPAPAQALAEDLPVSGAESEGLSEIGDSDYGSDVENLFFCPIYAGPLAQDSEVESPAESSLIDEELTEEEDTGESDREEADGEDDDTNRPH
ncbi:hypothetical protein ACP4OV_014076 [Aristida adscensionis]